MASQPFRFSLEVTIPPNYTAALEAASAKALKVVAAELDGRFTAAISENVWVWPRPSKRGTQAGTLRETAKKWRNADFNTGSPRSIVDSGELKASGDFSLSNVKAEWSWTTDYATFVHDGAWIYPWQNRKAAKVLLPARPWTEAVLFGHPHYSGEPYDLDKRLREEFLKAIN